MPQPLTGVSEFFFDGAAIQLGLLPLVGSTPTPTPTPTPSPLVLVADDSDLFNYLQI